MTNKCSSVDLLKFFGTLVMIVVHCDLFLRFHIPLEEGPRLFGNSQYFALVGFFSLALPSAAGFTLRHQLSSYIVGNRLLNYPESQLMKITLGLIGAECLKNLISLGWHAALVWDALHVVAVGFLIINLIVARFGTRSLLLVSGFFILASPWVSKILAPFVWPFTHASQFAIENPIASFATSLFIVSWAALIGWAINYKSKTLKNLTITLIISLAIATLVYFNPFAFWLLLNLPISALVYTGPESGHLWPLMPWGGLVIGGFLIAHYIEKPSSKKFSLLIITGFVGMMIFCVLGLADYTNAASDLLHFSSNILNLGPATAIGVLGFFSFFIGSTSHLLRNIDLNSSIIRGTSESILLIYVLHFVLATHLAPAFAYWLSPHDAAFAFPLFVILILLLLVPAISSIFKSRLEFNFKRKR